MEVRKQVSETDAKMKFDFIRSFRRRAKMLGVDIKNIFRIVLMRLGKKKVNIDISPAQSEVCYEYYFDDCDLVSDVEADVEWQVDSFHESWLESDTESDEEVESELELDCLTGLPRWWDLTEESLVVKPCVEDIDVICVVESFRRFREGTITSVARIQNAELFKRFRSLRKEMKERNPNTEISVYLYYGAEPDTVDKINKCGFQKRFCMRNDFGRGVHFAAKPCDAVEMTTSKPDKDGYHCIYVAEVLVGNCARGAPGMEQPPILDPSTGRRYDSVSGKGKSIIVVFNDDQAYPEYLIKYRK